MIRRAEGDRSEGKDCSAIFIVIEWSFLYFQSLQLELTLKLNDLKISIAYARIGEGNFVAINVLSGILKEFKNYTIFFFLKLLLTRKGIVIWENIITECFFFIFNVKSITLKLNY